jgi:serine/threonine protein kinase
MATISPRSTVVAADGPAAEPAVAAVRPGAQVDKYLLLECVGKGGAGVVYRALHTTLKTLVAVKFLRADLGPAEGSGGARLAREAQLLAQLNHPNVVRVLDFEDHPTRPYLVMEFVEGFTAADLIEQSQRVSPARALEIVIDVAAGLEAAWKLGIIHRDVKPANVLVTRTAGSKLVDFELAACARSDVAPPDRTVGCGAGTVGYMSPEAIGRAPVDHRSDIYSLGATLFHLAAGRLPFTGDSQYEIIFKQIEEPPPVLHECAADASPRLSAVVQTMMAKDPAARFQTYAELRTELEAVLLATAWRGSLAAR